MSFSETVFESSHGGSHHEDENLKSWTWFQSLYYALISLTTIGFGDFFMPSASDEHKVDITELTVFLGWVPNS